MSRPAPCGRAPRFSAQGKDGVSTRGGILYEVSDQHVVLYERRLRSSANDWRVTERELRNEESPILRTRRTL